MPKLYTQIGEGEFRKLTQVIDDERNLQLMRRGRDTSTHAYDECERPFRCSVHKRQFDREREDRRVARLEAELVRETATRAAAEARRLPNRKLIARIHAASTK